ncbi:MAG TPA: flippase-like domain-containing protein [Candidatus Latescibacteria bacterium]|nr:flippase-like domain-containing protein [Candidatus Latescibacterota bacterium]
MSKKSLIAIKFLIMFAVLAVLITEINPEKIANALSEMNQSLLLVVLLLLIPNLSIQAVKWGYLLKDVKSNANLGEIVVSLLVGFSFALISPGRLGEMARGVCIRGESKLRLAGLTAVDKIFLWAIIMIAGMVSLILLGPPVVVVFAFGVIILVLAGCFDNLRLLKRTIARISSRLPFAEKSALLLEGFEGLSTKKSFVLLLMSATFYGIYFTQFYLLVLSFADIPFRSAVSTIPLVLMAKTFLPITPVDVGVREAASVLLFTRFGVEKAYAFNAAFMLFLINVLLPGLMGFFFIPSIRLKE